MADRVKVEEGQVWQDWDKRFRTDDPLLARLITVLRVDEKYAYCDSAGRDVRIQLKRFVPNSTGYKFIRSGK